ncbi:YDG/SRA domain-containing protein [Spirosoma luteum]|uniref:YDG/SRA domain-containing protein n=1 Tax=Spirosoma luteum TaxID=431553 RepID=UPI00035EFB96|nr:YDG/SRA domain-containing protein [Spirosoma luteum]
MRVFGHVVGIPEGSEFENRYTLSQYGVHRPLQAGISGSQDEGADSIVLSGGYEDDKDYGDVIIYTGHGGRSQVTGLQVADQKLTRQNLALALNCQRGTPVRVIRGYKHTSPISPKEGYRYDGLYRVDSYWQEQGLSGFVIWRFRLEKIHEQLATDTVEEPPSIYENSERIEITIQRIMRDTKLALSVKEMYNFECQVCQIRILTNAGLYAEAAHIQPLGMPHNGPDSIDNILCLCPNHHVMFDFGGFSIADDLTLIGLEGGLYKEPKHFINPRYLQYHREHFADKI